MNNYLKTLAISFVISVSLSAQENNESNIAKLFFGDPAPALSVGYKYLGANNFDNQITNGINLNLEYRIPYFRGKWNINPFINYTFNGKAVDSVHLINLQQLNIGTQLEVLLWNKEIINLTTSAGIAYSYLNNRIQINTNDNPYYKDAEIIKYFSGSGITAQANITFTYHLFFIRTGFEYSFVPSKISDQYKTYLSNNAPEFSKNENFNYKSSVFYINFGAIIPIKIKK